ncbi:hypothetical protein Pmani_000177 [Petrolisthes manimaculis]|uniref:FXYD domain-containing ion transport regulator n=1 Tax=Petrolisthes manimaculis TaxID=1843537 RepID=A0AAE1UT78_9EUCA|nr:hypothetical protein Pmani_000177 [Petrolisthes manimaculis]
MRRFGKGMERSWMVLCVMVLSVAGVDKAVAGDYLTRDYYFDFGDVTAIIVFLTIGILGGLACLGGYARSLRASSY